MISLHVFKKKKKKRKKQGIILFHTHLIAQKAIWL